MCDELDIVMAVEGGEDDAPGLHDSADAVGDGPPEAPRGSKDPAPPPKKPRGVNASNAEMRTVRGAHKNTLHYMTMLLGDLHKLRKLDAVQLINDNIIGVFKQRLTASKTIRGTCEFYVGMADGLCTKTLYTCWDVLEDDVFIRT